MNHTQLAQEIFETAKEKGFWDKERNKPEMLMLIVSELSEALECDRKSIRFPKNSTNPEFCKIWVYAIHEDETKTFPFLFEYHVKDTLEDELADAAIRILDTVRGAGIYTNEEIEVRFKDSVVDLKNIDNNAECLMEITSNLSKSYEAIQGNDLIYYVKYLIFAFKQIEILAQKLNIDLEWHMRAKMDYNKTRPFMHNKKY